jgi:molybdate transport system substrate-binding protein
MTSRRVVTRRTFLAAVLVAHASGLVRRASAAPTEMIVSAAISMKDVLEAIGERFAAREAGARVRFNLGASGTLARQIEAGAPADVFVSAALGPMDDLERAGLLERGSRRTFARNLLAVVVPADSAIRLERAEDLLDARVRRIAIGNPRTVPAGQYAEASLRAAGLLDRVRAKLVLGENVRQVLEYVARGEVDAAWVYTTDAAMERHRVREAFRPPESTYPPVLSPVAVLRDARAPRLARAFVDLLAGPDGRSIVARFGFLAPPDAR